MPYNKQGEDGKFQPRYDPDEFVAAVEARDFPTTADVADVVDCPHRTALHHLNQLEGDGRLASRTIGPAKVWRVADDTTPEATSQDTSDVETNC
ncbi:ArsR family transcriptional regulator (plasmid) [Halarchaeum sp. CBA1220]|uniref:ArsR family transcriptional regulator n=1 Tax=Halarchaeum sp. CBA1220 TaxID=1853682 RepID=UPI000F6AB513|nr:ArsR family transcriptional regulator [Halarchaeum sp. CBA1220]QLC35743.1 ArsR family transcriptional regulator [Halarchaeum sp. CBA1220]